MNINEDMKTLYGEPNYYPTQSAFGALRTDLLQKNIDNNTNNFEMVYGQSHGPVLIHKNNMYAYSGYTVRGDSVSTEGAPWYAGWSGTKIQDFNMIKEPWMKTTLLGIKRNKFDAYFNEGNKYLKKSNGTFEQSIIDGLNEHYAGQLYKKFMYNNQNSTLQDKPVYR